MKLTGMNKSDQWINILLMILIIIHVSFLFLGIMFNKLPLLLPTLNATVAFSVLIYWIQKQLRIQQHIIDMQEMMVLGMEAVVIVTAGYFVFTAMRPNVLKVLQYIFFGIHLTALVLFLVFMLTFKIKRLI